MVCSFARKDVARDVRGAALAAILALRRSTSFMQKLSMIVILASRAWMGIRLPVWDSLGGI